MGMQGSNPNGKHTAEMEERNYINRRFERLCVYVRAHEREVWFAIKTGVAVSLGFLVLLFGPTYVRWFERNAVWCVITVCLICEPTVGALFSKGVNRALGTMVAIVLALLVGEVADSIRSGGAYFLLASVFVIGSIITFMKSVPPIKGKYDYASGMALLTFCLLIAGEYGFHKGWKIAIVRLLLVLIGFVIAAIIHLVIKPVFAGTDLHCKVANHFDKIAVTLETCVQSYMVGKRFDKIEEIWKGRAADDLVHQGYKDVIQSKGEIDSLLYKDVTLRARRCAFNAVAMDGCLRSEIQAPVATRQLLAQPMAKLTTSAVKVLHTLGESLREMRYIDTRLLLEEMEGAVLELQRELQDKAGTLTTPTHFTDQWVEQHLDEEDKKEHVVPSSVLTERSERTIRWVPGTPSSTKSAAMMERICSRSHVDQLKVPVPGGVAILSVIQFVCLLVEFSAALKHAAVSVRIFSDSAGFTETGKKRVSSTKDGGKDVALQDVLAE